ncbi:hypothetical protein K3725_01220 [Leisingera sp. S132]|uniref:hypothetical protein n=1 Tax=Leisingera sp. S132 TaxID=2867016 RepID=UPI0021A28E2B|nr:hypothetical protein [Leisingera sp. S132]UWQ79661.1 hypothetical protein K3725_01220 [Leisingera sp. S132]
MAESSLKTALFIGSAAALVIGLVNYCVAETGVSEQVPRAVFLEVGQHEPLPGLQLRTEQAAGGEWLLHIDAIHFTFSDVCLVQASGTHTGHAHVYQGGEKVGTAFTPVFSLGRLEPGQHEFSVMLRAQDHRALIGPYGLIAARVKVTVPGPPKNMI